MHFVITGATGFLGSHFVARCASDARVTRITAIARPGDSTAFARVKAALEAARGGTDLDTTKLRVVEGELTRPLCGLSEDLLDELTGQQSEGERPAAFWHVAASLLWAPGKRDVIFRNNVDGTRNALELAERLAASMFVYVSTAYTCGGLDGHVPEAIHEAEPRFNNAYEESKWTAEKLVRDFCTERGMRFLIMRPSIIVGTSHDFRASGSDSGLYGLIRELRTFQSKLGDSTEVVRFATRRDTPPSFVPVDYVVEDMMACFAREREARTQDVYHLTADVTGEDTARVGTVFDYILEQLGLEHRIKVLNDEIADPTALEQFFAKRVSFFAAYMKSTKHFVRSMGTERRLSAEAVNRFVDSEVSLTKP